MDSTGQETTGLNVIRPPVGQFCQQALERLSPSSGSVGHPGGSALSCGPRVAGIAVKEMHVVGKSVSFQPRQRRLKLCRRHRGPAFSQDPLEDGVVAMRERSATGCT